VSPALRLQHAVRPSYTPIGTWLKIPTTEPTEIMAFAGFDFVIVDLEHAPLTLETAYRLINLAVLAGVSPLVRVPDHGPRPSNGYSTPAPTASSSRMSTPWPTPRR